MNGQMSHTMMNLLKTSLLSASLLALVACGGGGSGSGTKTDSGGSTNSASLTVKYTDPDATTGACIIQLNKTLSTGSLLVFDVIGEKPDTASMGVALNLQVDQAKLVATAIPGARDPEVEHVLLAPIASPGGFAAGTALAMRKDRVDGLAMMVCCIRRPAPAVAATGVLMRFAYQVVGTPVQGVIRTQVMDGSGILDANGRLISGTAPVIGRLEYS